MKIRAQSLDIYPGPGRYAPATAAASHALFVAPNHTDSLRADLQIQKSGSANLREESDSAWDWRDPRPLPDPGTRGRLSELIPNPVVHDVCRLYLSPQAGLPLTGRANWSRCLHLTWISPDPDGPAPSDAGLTLIWCWLTAAWYLARHPRVAFPYSRILNFVGSSGSDQTWWRTFPHPPSVPASSRSVITKVSGLGGGLFTRRWPGTGSMSGHRRRLWPSIEPAPDQCVFVSNPWRGCWSASGHTPINYPWQPANSLLPQYIP